jgi:hypothetical protein
MKTTLAIAVLVYMMVQAVFFGAGAILGLATPASDHAMMLMLWVVAVSSIVAIPVAWMIAPRLRARYWREHASGTRSARAA